MASAWATSWGSSWGDSWGASGAAVAVVATPTGAGNTDWLRRKKKKGKTLRWSELSRTEQMAMALAEKSIPLAEVTDDTEFDDDEILIRALSVTLSLHE